jgi:hypothetical protein
VPVVLVVCGVTISVFPETQYGYGAAACPLKSMSTLAEAV